MAFFALHAGVSLHVEDVLEHPTAEGIVGLLERKGRGRMVKGQSRRRKGKGGEVRSGTTSIKLSFLFFGGFF